MKVIKILIFLVFVLSFQVSLAAVNCGPSDRMAFQTCEKGTYFKCTKIAGGFCGAKAADGSNGTYCEMGDTQRCKDLCGCGSKIGTPRKSGTKKF